MVYKRTEHVFMSVDSKGKDFIVYNASAYKMTEEEINNDDLIQLTNKEITPVIQKLKSEAWSSGCNWFFVIQDEGIYLMNVFNDEFWLCKKHSSKFIEMYLEKNKK